MQNETPITLVDAKGNPIAISQPMDVGRSADAAISIADDQVSRRHARLTPTPDGLQVDDLGSSNGTTLNGERLPSFVAKDGDVIGFYTHKFLVKVAVATPPADIDKTRLHVPAPALAQAALATPPEVPSGKPASVQPSSKPDRAWWDTSDEGPVGTMLFKPGQLGLDADLAKLLELPPPTVPRLVGLSADLAGKCFDLDATKTVIGREAGCTIRIDHDGVSAKHAQIVHENSAWKLINLLSSNGTFVNDQRVQSAYLNSGDELKFGPVGFIFQLPGATSRLGTAAPSVSRPAAPMLSGNAKSNVAMVAAAIGFVAAIAIAWYLL